MRQVDNDTLKYDVEAYPFVDWVKERIEDAGYDASDLHNLHNTVPIDEISALTRRIIGDTNRPEFREMTHRLCKEVLGPYLGAELAVQRFKNLRILLPDRPQMSIHYHNGLWYGHGLGETTVWMPLVETGGSASLQVVGLEASRRLGQQAIDENWDHDTMQQQFQAEASAFEGGPGDILLFQQEGLHGNTPSNTTGQTRVSFDMRVAAKGEILSRKMVGGYFELVDTPEPATCRAAPPKVDGMTIGYVNNNTNVTYGIPIHVQRLMMKEYIQRYDISYTYEHLEVEVFPHLPILWHILQKDKPAEVVFYSIFALPDESHARMRLLNIALEHQILLHFSNEDLRLTCAEDRDYIEAVIRFAPYVKVRDLVPGVAK